MPAPATAAPGGRPRPASAATPAPNGRSPVGPWRSPSSPHPRANRSAAGSRNSSRNCCRSAVSPPPCGYRMPPVMPRPTASRQPLRHHEFNLSSCGSGSAAANVLGASRILQKCAASRLVPNFRGQVSGSCEVAGDVRVTSTHTQTPQHVAADRMGLPLCMADQEGQQDQTTHPQNGEGAQQRRQQTVASLLAASPLTDPGPRLMPVAPGRDAVSTPEGARQVRAGSDGRMRVPAWQLSPNRRVAGHRIGPRAAFWTEGAGRSDSNRPPR